MSLKGLTFSGGCIVNEVVVNQKLVSLVEGAGKGIWESQKSIGKTRAKPFLESY